MSHPSRPGDLADPAFERAYPLDPHPCRACGSPKAANRGQPAISLNQATLTQFRRYQILARRKDKIEYSSGAWTRTRTTQLQRLVGCQLPYAGACSSGLLDAAATVNHDTGRDGIGGYPDGIERWPVTAGLAWRYPAWWLRPSLRSCGRGPRRAGRRCAGILDTYRPRFSGWSSGCGASASPVRTDRSSPR